MFSTVLAITGASGAIYAVRLLQALLISGRNVELTISPAAAQVLKYELQISIDLQNFDPATLVPAVDDHDSKLASLAGGPSVHAMSSVFTESDVGRGQVAYHHYQDFSAGIASGSFLTEGMVICPCSMGSLAAIANGLSANLIHRAADVHLKERRKLIVVPRESPLGSIQLENMKRLVDAGGTVMPAMPGFYNQPQTIHDLVDFMVSRILDHLGVEQSLTKRWGK